MCSSMLYSLLFSPLGHDDAEHDASTRREAEVSIHTKPVGRYQRRLLTTAMTVINDISQFSGEEQPD